MVTTSQAIERVRDGLSLSDATVRYAARYLADAGLWPKGKPGGGKNAAHVDIEHAVNLLLALAVSDDRRNAPALVPTYRALPRLDAAAPWPTLAGCLAGLIGMADAEGERFPLICSGVEVFRTYPSAVISGPSWRCVYGAALVEDDGSVIVESMALQPSAFHVMARITPRRHHVKTL